MSKRERGTGAVYQVKGSKIWRVGYTDANGKYVRESSGEENKTLNEPATLRTLFRNDEAMKFRNPDDFLRFRVEANRKARRSKANSRETARTRERNLAARAARAGLHLRIPQGRAFEHVVHKWSREVKYDCSHD